MKILVTGVAGFIGSHLSERLASLGHEVVGIDCFTDYYDRALKNLNAEDVTAKNIPIHEVNLASDDLTEVLDGVEFVYHLAGQPGISASTPFDHYVANNIIATQQLLDACQQVSALKCFVNIATSSVYGKDATSPETVPPEPTSVYGVTKLAAEQLVLARQREVDFPACSLRIFSVYGPRERPEKLYPKLIGSIINDKPFPLFEGSESHSRSYTFVGDIIDGFVAALHNYDKIIGEIINLGTDEERTTAEGIEIVENLLGKKANKQLVPKRPGDQLRTCANIEKAGRLLGYEPSTTLQDGLAAEVSWFKERVYG
ncbi:MAG: NAD-dependent epimerase/dehydratase family protein [Chloroflexota bacterium]